MEIVSTAFGFLIPYLAHAGSDAADEGLRRLWSSMTARAEASSDDAARTALARLRDDPADPHHRAAAIDAVASLAARDAAFLAELRSLVESVKAERTDVAISTTVSDHARIEKQVNIGTAGDVTI
jgi:hypothetical protein